MRLCCPGHWAGGLSGAVPLAVPGGLGQGPGSFARKRGQVFAAKRLTLVPLSLGESANLRRGFSVV